MLATTALAAAPLIPTLEIAPGVQMPRINLGTCCGSEVTNSFPSWWAAGGHGVDTAFDYGKEVPGGKETELSDSIAKTGAPREALFITTKIRTGLDQEGTNLCVALEGSVNERGVSKFGRGFVDIRPRLDKHLHDPKVTTT